MKSTLLMSLQVLFNRHCERIERSNLIACRRLRTGTDCFVACGLLAMTSRIGFAMTVKTIDYRQ